MRLFREHFFGEERMLFDGAQWIMEVTERAVITSLTGRLRTPALTRTHVWYLLRHSGLLAETPANEVY